MKKVDRSRKISHSASFHAALDGELITSLSCSDTEDVEESEIEDSTSWGLYRLGDLAIQWRPHKIIHKAIVFITLPLLLWAISYLLVGDDALPGGTLFSLFVLEFGGIALGTKFCMESN